MKKLKTQKGITLVALIITIVVLLILAAVAIGAAKDSDIIGYARNASDSYTQARNNELSEIQSAEDLLKQYATQQNPWVAKGLTIPVKYGKKYTGPVTGLGLSSLTIILGTNGELIVEEAKINSNCNDSNITSITNNKITYNDDGDEIRIEFSADGKEIKVFYNSIEIGTLIVEENVDNTTYYGFYELDATAGFGMVFAEEEHTIEGEKDYVNVGTFDTWMVAFTTENIYAPLAGAWIEPTYTATLKDGTMQTFNNAVLLNGADGIFIGGYLQQETSGEWKLVPLNSNYDSVISNLDSNGRILIYNSLTEGLALTKSTTFNLEQWIQDMKDKGYFIN